MSSPTQSILQDSLASFNLPVAVGKERIGLDFYKFMFTEFPDLRKYFKGAQNYTVADIEKSERFLKQGQRMLLGMHLIAATYDQPDVLKAYAREMVNKHRQFKMDIALWSAFFDVWLAFMATRGTVDEKTKQAWKSAGKTFADECVRFTKEVERSA